MRTRAQLRGPVRLVLSGTVAAAVISAAVVLPAHTGWRNGSLAKVYDASKVAAAEARPHVDPVGADGHGHDHNDPSTKNLVSRAGETGKDAQDPTSAEERAAHTAYTARNREETPDPELTTAAATYKPPAVPRNKYAMATGCYGVSGVPLRFQATDLGSYLLYTKDMKFVGTDGTTDEPSPSTDWKAVPKGDRFAFRSIGDKGAWLKADKGSFSSSDKPQAFTLKGRDGCAVYPEAAIDIKGAPMAGISPIQEVRGYVDAHTHGMAFEFLGGAHCGKPWDRYGAAYALVDCPDHQTGVNPLESFLSGNPSHDPVGWPTFKDWPAPESLTHEGTYYKWMERSWRGGQRLFTNLLVENNQLCRIYPFKRDGLDDLTCDEMASVERQAKDMYAMQDYIDAQWGGPGKGWYRIVKSPWQARRVINAGKMAIIMGIETSVPFGCTFKTSPAGDVPACDEDSIDQQLAKVHKWGVRQMELVNKFDNALSGITGDGGETGAVVNNANFLETGTYWDMRHCEPAHPDAHDKNQYAAPGIDAEQQDALFGAIGEVFGGQKVGPVYPPPDHCNQRGLTDLGAHLVDEMAKRGMLIDPDHMSVAARNTLLDQVEDLGYSGIMSSHSWSTEDAYPRIYEMGGYIAPYAGDSTGFVEKWRKHLGWADPRYYFGFGYGADMNGLGAQGDPRGADVPNPVTYPFEGFGGVTIGKQTAGERTWDINVDGVAQYGLYPDWIQDLRNIADTQAAADPALADGDDLFEDMGRGAEAYLQTWERALGIAADPCRNPDLQRSPSAFAGAVDKGMSVKQVLRAVGQPYTRLDDTFSYCATGDATMSVVFDGSGKVSAVRRG